MNPFLSVIIPVRNGEKYIAAALRSIQEQARDGIEVLVVDDQSTDRTAEIVEEFSGILPIRLIIPSTHKSEVEASNIGLREGKGEWACLLHCDDVWLPGRIEKLWGEMAKAPGAMIVHNVKFVAPDGKDLGLWTCPFSDGVIPSDRFVERLLVQNFIAPLSPVFRRQAVLDFGGMDETLWVCPDWDLWLRLGALGPVRFIAETLGAYRVHPGSQTVSRNRKPEEWEEQLRVVLARHMQTLASMGKDIRPVERAARVSIAVNSALLGALRGEPSKPWNAAIDFLGLGPAGWRRYLRDSRIRERLGARLKAQRSLRSSRLQERLQERSGTA